MRAIWRGILVWVIGAAVFCARGDELATLGVSVNFGPRPLHFFSPQDGKILRSVGTGFRPAGYGEDVADAGMAYGNGFIWGLGLSVNGGVRPLYKIKLEDGSVAEKFTTQFRPIAFGKDVAKFGLTFGDGFLWGIGNGVAAKREIFKVSPTNGAVVGSIWFEVPGSIPAVRMYGEVGVAFGEGSIWILGSAPFGQGRPLFRVNATAGGMATNIVTALKAPNQDASQMGMAYGDGYLWVFGNSLNGRARPIYKIKPTDGSVAETMWPAFGALGSTTDVAQRGLVYIPGKP